MSRFEAPPGIITNGLVLNLDAGNPDSYTRSQPPYVEVLVVAGGGGGGSHVGGGGGAGGLIYNTAYQLNSAAAVTVTVGSFGNGGSADARGGNGSNSVFGSLTAIGGGGGGSWGGAGDPNGQNGGSGGGGAGTQGVQYGIGGSATAGQGFNGGTVGPRSGYNASGCGGGGAGVVATSRADASDATKLNGAAGLPFSILGTTYYFAGGGGPGTFDSVGGGDGGAGGGAGGASSSSTGGTGNTQSINSATNGGSGYASTGGTGATNSGGGGGGGAGGSAGVGGAGGSGIVIVRYPGLPAATGGTITYINGYTIHTFTTSGTFTPYTWNDVSGNNNSGSLINGVGFNSYQSGGYLNFDGSDDYVVVPGASSTNLSSVLTADTWVYYRSGNGRIFQKDDWGSGTYTRCWEMGGYAGTFRMEMWHQNGTGTIGSGNPLAINGWTYLTLTFDGTNIKMYQNSTLVNTINFPGDIRTDINTPITVGGRWVGEFLDGGIGVARLYNRALSAAEITQNFNAQRNRFGI
jgi:hypothetical protein